MRFSIAFAILALAGMATEARGQNPPSGGGGGVTACVPASASGTAYTCAPSPALASYVKNSTTLAFTPDVSCTPGAVTINVSGLGAKALKEFDGVTNPTSTDCGSAGAAGNTTLVAYNGTAFTLPVPGTTGPAGEIQGTPVVKTANYALVCGDGTGLLQPIQFNGSSLTVTINFAPSTCTTAPTIIVENHSASTTLAFTLTGITVNGNSSLTALPAMGAAGAFGYVLYGDATGANWSARSANGANGTNGSTTRGLSYMFAGSDLVTGVISGAFTMPSTCTLAAWDINNQAADGTSASDSQTIKVLKVASGTTSPGTGNSINTSGVSISSAAHVHSTTLTDFTTTTFTQYDVVAFDLSTYGGTAGKVTVSLSFTGCTP